MSTQLFLDFSFSPPEVPDSDITDDHQLKPIDMRCATIAWIAQQEAAGIATKVPTRVSKYQADVAAFWNRTRAYSNNPGPERLHVPCHTMIVEVRKRRTDCWPDFTKSSELLPDLRDLKRQRTQLEAHIREAEPNLRETATLFDEFSEWNYSQSTNPEYQRVCREIHRINKALYKGTRFESIRSAHVADFLYLAVPHRTVHPNELADGWGLIWIHPDQSIELIAQADNQHCPPENRFHLVQNIATANTPDLLFRHGVHLHKDDSVTFLRRPHRRTPRKKS